MPRQLGPDSSGLGGDAGGACGTALGCGDAGVLPSAAGCAAFAGAREGGRTFALTAIGSGVSTTRACSAAAPIGAALAATAGTALATTGAVVASRTSLTDGSATGVSVACSSAGSLG